MRQTLRAILDILFTLTSLVLCGVFVFGDHDEHVLIVGLLFWIMSEQLGDHW
jgi:hypothetical protein